MSGASSTGALEQFKASYLAAYTSPLSECESRLKKIAIKPDGILGKSSLETLAAGGKRLRPLLVFLSTPKPENILDSHYRAAVAVELVHMATLVHDDMLDGADLRRGRPTLFSQYGSLVSTAAGDYLFSSAFDVLSGAGEPVAVSLLAQTSLNLSLGELVQKQQTRDYGLTVDAYEERCRLKTAGLFSAACSLGGLLSGLSQESMEALREFGHYLGLAFQIADDILDFAGDPADTGKKIGADLRDGTVTLPLILALKRDRSLLDVLLGNPEELPVDKICLDVKETGALEAAGEVADRYAELAAKSLNEVDRRVETEPLALIARMAAHRNV